MNLFEAIKNNLNEADDVYVNDTKVVGNGGVHTGVLKSIVDRNKGKISDILSNWNINSISYQENNDSGQSYGGVIIDATNKQDSRYTTATTFWLMLEANDSSYMDCYQVLEFTNGDDFESLVDDDSIHQLISDEALGMRELVAKIESVLISLITKVYSDFDDIISYRANNNILTESDFALDFEKNIPHHMRFKYHDSIPVNDSYGREKGRSLYWVTQEPFDDLDIERFRDAFVDTGFSDAYVTVRDLSNYDFNSDKDEGVLVHISKDGKIDADDYLAKANDRGWFNEADNDVELDGESKSSSIYSDNVTSKCKLIKNMLSHYGNVSHVTPQLSFNDEDEAIDFSITVDPDKFARQENSVEIYGTLYLDKDGNFSMVDVKTSSGPNILNRNFITALNALYTFVEHNGDSYDG